MKKILMSPLKFHISSHDWYLAISTRHSCVCPKSGPGFTSGYVVVFVCLMSDVASLILMELLIITVATQESEIISFQFWGKITCQWV